MHEGKLKRVFFGEKHDLIIVQDRSRLQALCHFMYYLTANSPHGNLRKNTQNRIKCKNDAHIS
jgi:hypothetical protein